MVTFPLLFLIVPNRTGQTGHNCSCLSPAQAEGSFCLYFIYCICVPVGHWQRQVSPSGWFVQMLGLVQSLCLYTLKSFFFTHLSVCVCIPLVWLSFWREAQHSRLNVRPTATHMKRGEKRGNSAVNSSAPLAAGSSCYWYCMIWTDGRLLHLSADVDD